MNVEYLVTLVTIPGSMLLFDSVKADHTFGLASDQLVGQPGAQIGPGISEQGQLAQWL